MLKKKKKNLAAVIPILKKMSMEDLLGYLHYNCHNDS
jgi:hypothetical protein